MELNMATAKASDGNAYSVPPNRPSSGSKNDGGSAAKLGSNTSLLDNVAVSRSQSDVFGSTVLDNDWADKVISGGTFAHNHVRPITKRVTTELAGVASTALSTTAGQPGLIRSIHKLEVLRTTKTASGIRDNKFNRFTHEWDNGYPQVSADTLASDTAATPTRAAPGQLTYKLGQPVPVTDNDYKAKTG
jgi:hypothetical protein